MSVGAWDPSQAAGNDSFVIDQALLNEFIKLSDEDKLGELNTHLSNDTVDAQAPLMTQTKERWFEAAQPLDEAQIVSLIRFFTIAEMQLTGWEAGSESPVIWLTKVLRQRKAPLDRSMLLWIRENSDNRFIPNGAL
ncbi:MAG: hypothetical protein ACRBBW_00770 [Cellvibrionaceae bacterium]